MNLDYSDLKEKVPRYVSSPFSHFPVRLSTRLEYMVINRVLTPVTLSQLIGIIVILLVVPKSLVTMLIILSVIIALYVRLRLIVDRIRGGSLTVMRLSNFAFTNQFHFEPGLRQSKKSHATNSKERVTFKGVFGHIIPSSFPSYSISGTYAGLPFHIYNLKTKSDAYNVCSIDLQAQFPHLYVMSTKYSKAKDVLPLFFDETKNVVLERSFESHFTALSLASPTDTLKKLPPDFLTRLIDHDRKIDLEIIEDKLYLIARYTYVDQRLMRDFFLSLDSLIPQFYREESVLAPVS